MKTPFKMKGHELPGPSQRSPLEFEQQDQLSDRNTKTSGFLEKTGWGDRINQLTAAIGFGSQKKGVKVGEGYEGEEEYSAIKEGSQATQSYVDSGVTNEDDTGVSGTGITSTGDDAAKKKVDVEVTVNGQKV